MPLIRGELPPFIVGDLERDETGLLTGFAERHFELGPKSQRIDPAWLDQSNAPDVGFGIPCVTARARIKDGLCIVTYFFAGREESYAFEEEATTYEFEPSEEDTPIELHPFIREMVEKYGWDKDSKSFPEFLNAQGQGEGFTGNRASGQKPNPLYGYESWSSYAGIYRRTYTRRSVPVGAWKGVNQTIEKPPGIDRIGEDFSNRIFVKLAPGITVRGNAVVVAESYALCKPGAKEASQIIYDGKGLKGGRRSGGLRTGGLSTGTR